MKITLSKTQTVLVSEELNLESLIVYKGGSKDIDSNSLEIWYKGKAIGYGHINNKTNFAHITLDEENEELEDYLVEGIENRTIELK